VSPPSRALVVAFRVVLLVASATAVAAAVAIGLAGRGGGAAVFVCPMHAEVRTSAPASCPICGMALERVGASPSSRGGATPDLTAVENVRKHRIMDFVRKRSLLPGIRELRGPAWVDREGVVVTVLYDDQIAALAVDEAASFSPARAPGEAVPVRRTGEAAVPWDDSTSRLRFRAPARGGTSPRAGDVGWLVIAPKARDVLTVPSAAVISAADGPYVLMSDDAGGFERRPIRIGETFLKQGFCVVLEGLHEHDRVAARATFFLDAERKLASAGGEPP
jgi:hypothetical protein